MISRRVEAGDKLANSTEFRKTFSRHEGKVRSEEKDRNNPEGEEK